MSRFEHCDYLKSGPGRARARPGGYALSLSIRWMLSLIAMRFVSPRSLDRLRIPLDLPPDVARDLDSIVRFRISTATTLPESAECLLLLLGGGYSVWEDGRLYEIRVLVAALNGLRITIQSREHGPAHFHVQAPRIEASFAILDCRLLSGDIGGRDRRLVEYWYALARPLLVKVWNSTRPSDCPVGPIEA